MTVECSTINVQIPATITATPSESCLEGTCTVDVSVDWTNTGDVPGDFTPNISILQNQFLVLKLLAQDLLRHILCSIWINKSRKSTYICPIPNEPYII